MDDKGVAIGDVATRGVVGRFVEGVDAYGVVERIVDVAATADIAANEVDIGVVCAAAFAGCIAYGGVDGVVRSVCDGGVTSVVFDILCVLCFIFVGELSPNDLITKSSQEYTHHASAIISM